MKDHLNVYAVLASALGLLGLGEEQGHAKTKGESIEIQGEHIDLCQVDHGPAW